jgi:hypothetical protein
MHYLNERKSDLEASGLPNSVNADESADNTDTSDLLGISCHALVSQLSRFCLDRQRPGSFLHMVLPSIAAERYPRKERWRGGLRSSPSSSTHLDLALCLGYAHLRTTRVSPHFQHLQRYAPDKCRVVAKVTPPQASRILQQSVQPLQTSALDPVSTIADSASMIIKRRPNTKHQLCFQLR